MERVFITGGSGFLGGHIIKQLLANNVEVHALRRATSNCHELSELDIHWHKGELNDLESMLRACPENVDAFFHVAASTNMWSKNNEHQNKVNLQGTEFAIQTALAKGAKRFIHTSSIAAFGQHKQVITELTEQKGNRSFCNYYRTKHDSELLVKAAVNDRNLQAVILNPCHIVGEGDFHNWSTMIQMVNDGTLPGVPPGLGSFCDVIDVAKAHLAAVELGVVGENYILSGVDQSFLSFVKQIGKVVNKPTPNWAVPAFVLHGLGFFNGKLSLITGKEPDVTPEKAMITCDKLKVSSKKAQQILGYNADADMHASLQRCVSWMQKEGLI